MDGIAKVHAATYALIQSMGLDAFQTAYRFVHENNTYSETGVNCNGPWYQMPVDGAIKILKVFLFPVESVMLNLPLVSSFK